MTGRWRTARSRRSSLLALAAVAGLLAALPAAASAGPTTAGSGAGVGLDVARALQAAAPYATVLDDGGASSCMTADRQPLVYRADRLVVRSRLGVPDLRRRVDDALRQVGSTGRAGAVEVIPLPQPTSGRSAAGSDPGLLPLASVTIDDGGGRAAVVAAARQLRRAAVSASPDYLLSPTGPVGMWPYGYPTATTDVQAPRAAGLGAGVQVFVYDNGLPAHRDGNWAPNVSRYSDKDVEQLDVVQPRRDVVDIYSGGHTLPLADILAITAPAAEVKAVRITEADGVATDVSAARRMASTLRNARPGPQIVLGAFGTPACDGGPGATDGDLVPLGLQAVTEALSRRGHSLAVFAAGNRATSRPFYPAALPPANVIAVGALDAAAVTGGTPWTSATRAAPVADFSNSGTWVDAYAPGVALPTRHVDGLRFPGGSTLHGRATVSGTSFAAPYVAGLLAEVIARDPDGDPLQAWRALAASGTRCRTTGSGVALALVSMDASATTAAPAGSEGTC